MSHNIQGAVLSLDWSKAFDRVSHSFLFKSMNKMGFNNNVISLIKLCCSDKKTCIQINGNLTEQFDIGRGIRQGCPLSMLIYILLKEPLYCYIKSCKILNSVEIKIRIMQGIKLTIYQKAVMINCIIYAKIWYISHIYPLPLKYANKIKKLTFHYLWGKKWEPIKRSTLTLPKCDGGLGILDIYHKSRGILVSSFLKSYLNEDGIHYLVEYYNFIRTEQLLNRTSEPMQVSYIGTEYYRDIISIVQKCTHIQGFPHITAKSICANIMQEHRPTVEGQYGLCNWKIVWINLCSVFILPNERETIYRYLHEILPTKKRLKDIRIIPSSVCDYCIHEETNTHMLYQCEPFKDTVVWFKHILKIYFDLSNPQMIRLSFLETPKLSRRSRNATVFFMSTYIVGMWQARASGMDPNVCAKFLKGKIIQKLRLIKYLLGDKIENVFFPKVCNLRWSDL